MQRHLLGIYLNDHLVGSTLDLELARRAARENVGNPLGVFLSDTLLPEIAQDRQTLERLMGRLGVPRSRAKIAGAWAAERLVG